MRAHILPSDLNRLATRHIYCVTSVHLFLDSACILSALLYCIHHIQTYVVMVMRFDYTFAHVIQFYSFVSFFFFVSEMKRTTSMTHYIRKSFVHWNNFCSVVVYTCANTCETRWSAYVTLSMYARVFVIFFFFFFIICDCISARMTVDWLNMSEWTRETWEEEEKKKLRSNRRSINNNNKKNDMKRKKKKNEWKRNKKKAHWMLFNQFLMRANGNKCECDRLNVIKKRQTKMCFEKCKQMNKTTASGLSQS